MKLPPSWFSVVNALVRAVLRSPLHRLMSASIMIVSFTGRRSGRRLSVPVRYVRDGDTVQCFTARSGLWWRNLRGGAPVTLRIAGRDVPCTAQVVENATDRSRAALARLIERYPQDAPYYEIRLDAGRRPLPGEIERVAGETVMIEATPG